MLRYDCRYGQAELYGLCNCLILLNLLWNNDGTVIGQCMYGRLLLSQAPWIWAGGIGWDVPSNMFAILNLRPRVYVGVGVWLG